VTEPRRAVPIRWWATLGALVIAVQAWAFAHWIITGNAVRTPTGPDTVPDWMKIGVWTFQAVCVAAGVFAVYWYFIRQWRRERRLNFDSYMIIAMYLTFWQDPLLNYFQKWATYNSTLVNFGSWTSSIPGWLSPDGHLMPEPLFFVIPTYGIVCFWMVVLTNTVMRKARQRWPGMGTAGLLGVAMAFFLLFGGVVEQAWMRLGIYAYPGAIKSLTLFPGNYYQYPLYELVFFAATFVAWSALRFFRNDKGETIAERGLEEIRAKRGKSAGWVRVLAITGAVNVAMLVVYNAPLQIFAMHAEPWPEDILSRSYLTDGFCGPGTTYACSGVNTPIPRRGGLHKDLQGNLVPPG
jgi:hypothetical protein